MNMPDQTSHQFIKEIQGVDITVYCVLLVQKVMLPASSSNSQLAYL